MSKGEVLERLPSFDRLIVLENFDKFFSIAADLIENFVHFLQAFTICLRYS